MEAGPEAKKRSENRLPHCWRTAKFPVNLMASRVSFFFHRHIAGRISWNGSVSLLNSQQF